jgi:hypothetical protein
MLMTGVINCPCSCCHYLSFNLNSIWVVALFYILFVSWGDFIGICVLSHWFLFPLYFSTALDLIWFYSGLCLVVYCVLVAIVRNVVFKELVGGGMKNFSQNLRHFQRTKNPPFQGGGVSKLLQKINKY